MSLLDPLKVVQSESETRNRRHGMFQSTTCTKYVLPVVRSSVIVFTLICAVIWTLCCILFGINKTFPGGSLFAVGVLLVLAILLGQLLENARLPALLGMLAAGLILKNAEFLRIANDFDLSILSPLRGMSIAVLLSRGAISVNPTAIKTFKWVIPQLAVGTCVFEAFVGSIASYFILHFPPLWSGLMGCIMSAMSQAAVMPYYLNLEKQRLGIENDVITIAKNACGLDAILAINMAECFFGAIFAYGDISLALQQGILEVGMGSAFGVGWGLLAGFFLNDKHGSILRAFTIFACGSISLLGFPAVNHDRGGPIGCFIGTLIATTMWRNFGVDGGNNKEVSAYLTNLWFIFQPLLFSIIGVRIDFNTVDWNLIEKAILCVFISLMFRMCAAFVLVRFAKGITFYEKLFISVAWIPKGTVQAALGPVALDTAIGLSSSAFIQDMGYKVMCISVLVSVVASILGSVLLLTVGPVLLKTSQRTHCLPS